MPLIPSHSADAPSMPAEINIAQELSRFARMLDRRRRLVVVCLLISAALATLYYATAPRVYRSRAELLIQQHQPETFRQGTGDLVTKDLMDTYKSMVTSDVVLGDAIPALPQQARLDFAKTPQREWLKRLREQLTVTVVRKTNILEISYRSRGPEAAALVVDGVVSAYLQFLERLHRSTARDMLEILTRERVRLEQEVEKKDEKLLALRREINDVFLREGDNYLSMEARELEGELSLLRQAREARIEAEAQLAALQAAIRNGEDLEQYVLAMAKQENDPVGERLGPDGPAISRMHEQLLEDMAELRSVRQRYGPAHSRVRELTERVAMTQDFLRSIRFGRPAALLQSGQQEDLSAALQQMVRQRLEGAAEFERRVAASFAQKKQKVMQVQDQMSRLEVTNRELNRLHQSLDSIVAQIEGIGIGEDQGMVRAAVLSSPRIPAHPVAPSLVLVAFVALTMGVGGGIACAYGADVLNDSFGSVDELRSQFSGLPVLGTIGKLPPSQGKGIESIHTYLCSDDVATEAFRTLRTGLALAGDGVRTVVVTSSEPADGKTTVVANLAVAIAQLSKRVLLIDADLRRPRLTSALSLRGSAGLTTILREERPVGALVRQFVQRSAIRTLEVLPAGPRAMDANELLAGERLAQLLGWAESEYDFVLIDSPPALVSDVGLVGRLADGVLLVVRPDKNRRRIVSRAVETLATMGVNLLGLVLNLYTAEWAKYAYGDAYGYGYRERYGYEPLEADEQGTVPGRAGESSFAQRREVA